MSAIARFYNHAGYHVSGYDRTPSRLTDALIKEGIEIHFDEDISKIPSSIKDTLVIYTPAIPEEMKELVYIKKNGYKLIKRSKALGEIAKGQKCLAVSGTHGKTTTSTLLAHILTSSNEGCNAFLGGISKNYNSNLLLSKNKVLVAEADEFDRSFHQLFPEIAIVTSVDADHLDIYNNIENIREAFSVFINQVKNAVIIKNNISDIESLTKNSKAKIYTYSFKDKADFYASDIEYLEGAKINFSLNTPNGKIEKCSLGIPGWVNVENAIAASAAAYLNGTSLLDIKKALASFIGVERRFDVKIDRKDLVYIDDYAHHPKEIETSINSISQMYPNHKICAIFQPHLYTRTRDFYKDFAKSLNKVGKVILLPIYPAREEPIPGINSGLILNEIEIQEKGIFEKNEIINEINKKNFDILVTLGAGDIDRLVPKIVETLTKNA